MQGPHQIVVGVDGSDGAAHAVRWAAQHARDTGAPLHLLYAAPLPDSSWRPFIGFDLLPRLPYLSLRNDERLAWRFQLVHATPPTDQQSRLIERTQSRTTRPLRSTPITGPSSLLWVGPNARPATVLNPSRFHVA